MARKFTLDLNLYLTDTDQDMSDSKISEIDKTISRDYTEGDRSVWTHGTGAGPRNMWPAGASGTLEFTILAIYQAGELTANRQFVVVVDGVSMTCINMFSGAAAASLTVDSSAITGDTYFHLLWHKPA